MAVELQAGDCVAVFVTGRQMGVWNAEMGCCERDDGCLSGVVGVSVCEDEEEVGRWAVPVTVVVLDGRGASERLVLFAFLVRSGKLLDWAKERSSFQSLSAFCCIFESFCMPFFTKKSD